MSTQKLEKDKKMHKKYNKHIVENAQKMYICKKSVDKNTTKDYNKDVEKITTEKQERVLNMNYMDLIRRVHKYGVYLFLHKLGVSVEEFFKLMCDKKGFTVDQINKICNILDIKTSDEINKIFFTTML